MSGQTFVALPLSDTDLQHAVLELPDQPTRAVEDAGDVELELRCRGEEADVLILSVHEHLRAVGLELNGERADTFNVIVRHLPIDQRRAIAARVLEGREYAELAASASTSEASVRRACPTRPYNAPWTARVST
jgi:DNA-directed RNA polymerase specialized sigma24 family protein